MRLLALVAAHLRAQDSPFALIGASALAVHGIARSTQDVDLLVADRRCLDGSYWDAVRAQGVGVAVHQGDDSDPLAGVVRLRVGGQHPVDVVVGAARWQAEVIARAEVAVVDDAKVPAVRRADLILLKLYAGGPQDAWDIVQLLALGPRPALLAEVAEGLPALPEHAARLWARIVAEGGPVQ